MQPDEPGVVSRAGTAPAQRTALAVAALLVLVLAAVGVIVPGAVGELFDGAAIALVIATPLLRVVGLAVDFARDRDWRFVAAAVGLLAVVGSGAVLAVL